MEIELFDKLFLADLEATVLTDEILERLLNVIFTDTVHGSVVNEKLDEVLHSDALACHTFLRVV